MSSQLPVLVVIVPLLAAFGISVVGWMAPRFCFPLALAAMATAFWATVQLLQTVMATGPVDYYLGGWPPPVGIAYRIDFLNGLVLVAVAGTALLALVGIKRRVDIDFPDRKGAFYTLYVLFVTGLFGILSTADAFNLYVLLEIASLTGYALIGMGRDRATLAGLNYVFMGTIGASLYLLGIGYLYLMTGTLNMADLASRLPALYDSRVVAFAFFLCMTGLFVKMAVFPLHVWLPAAYAESSSAASIVIAPLTTKVMVYVMIRISLTVFTPDFTFETLRVADAVVWLATLAIVAASLLALAQTRLKWMLAYIVVAEVGYMVGGFWLGNRDGITGAILHIVNDAAMTLCVFLAAGAIVSRTRSDQFSRLTGLFRRMPWTLAALAAGALSIIGVPPTCGFFSKWYLIAGGAAAGHYHYVAALLFSSLVNVILFFRIFEICHFEPFDAHDGHHEAPAMAEAPGTMLAPLLVVAVVLVVLGLYAGDIVTHIIRHAIPLTVI